MFSPIDIEEEEEVVENKNPEENLDKNENEKLVNEK